MTHTRPYGPTIPLVTPTYFQYNGKHYKQLYGTAMGSPVSVVVAKIVMQNAEEQALVTYSETLPLWLRYIDDTITAVHESKIDEFYEHLNRQNTSIQFTTEIEENGKIPFLDCLVTRRNNTLTEPLSTGKLHTLTDYCSNLDEKSTNFLRLTRQFHRRNRGLQQLQYRLHQTQWLSQTKQQLQQLIHHYSYYTLHTRDLLNHSMHTTALQHPRCTQTHVHFPTLTIMLRTNILGFSIEP